MSRLPKKNRPIRLAGQEYAVELVDLDERFGPRFSAQINHDTMKIAMDRSMGDVKRKRVLLHELVHGIDRCFGRHDLSEDQVVMLENGLWALFNDNPGLATALFGENA